MAYSSTNPVRQIFGGLSDGQAVFMYTSTHAHAAIEVVGFFADGKRHGMKVGDILIAANRSSDGSSAATLHVVSASTGAIAATSTFGSSAYSQAFNCSVTVASAT